VYTQHILREKFITIILYDKPMRIFYIHKN